MIVYFSLLFLEANNDNMCFKLSVSMFFSWVMVKGIMLAFSRTSMVIASLIGRVLFRRFSNTRFDIYFAMFGKYHSYHHRVYTFF